MIAERKTLKRVLEVSQEFIRRHLLRALRIRERLRLSEEAIHLMMAGAVGIGGGVIAVFFYIAFEFIKKVTLRHEGDLVEVAHMLDWWQRLIAPTLGGLAAGLVLHWGLQLVKKQGTTNMLEVVVAGDGRLPFRSAVIKAISSLISISTGASIGREGAIVQMSAVVASKMGQVANWQPYRLRLLVACGAASGIAAAYNAPVAGAVFAATIVLGNFSMNLFAPLVCASVAATMVTRSFFGIEPLYTVPPFNFTRLSQLFWFLLLGGLAGVIGASFLKMIRESEAIFRRMTIPLYARLTVGGFVVGVFAVHFPEVWGNGYSTTNRILIESLPIIFLLGLFLAKMLATLAAVGSGTVGGVFTPTLFLGASLGSLFGSILHKAGLGLGLPTGVFALVGMGSVLSATLHSPLLAMIMVFEISLNYSMMPPLMLSCVISTLIARQLHPASVYTESLREKGVQTERESQRPGDATQQTVGDLMRSPVPPLLETAPLREIAERFITSTFNFLPVVDAQSKFCGVVALQDLKEYLGSTHEFDGVIAVDVMRPPPPCLTPNLKLIEALPALLATEQRNVPVVNNVKDFKLVGAVSRAEALGILSEAISAGTPAKS